MDKLSEEMLAAYGEIVEDDARAGFKRLKADYEITIKEILGEMPQELRDFLENVRFVLAPIQV